MTTPKDPAETIAGLVSAGLAQAAREMEEDQSPPENDLLPDDPPPPESPDIDDGAKMQGVDWALVEACAVEPETDIGNARRFLTRFGSDVLYIEGLEWAVHDARRWALDYFGSAVRPLAHQTVEAIRFEGTVLKPRPEEEALIDDAKEQRSHYRALVKKARSRSPEEENELEGHRELQMAASAARMAIKSRRSNRVRYGKTSASTGKMDNMLSEARVYRTQNIRVLDSDAFALNCRNGTLRFVRDGKYWDKKLFPHVKADLISKLAEVDYEPEAAAPLFLKFIETVLPDQTVRSFMQRYLGYCLTAVTTEQVFVFLYGMGRNGKSTLVDVMCRILGDYATTVPFETLAGDDRRKGSEATPDLVRVPGARLVRASEPESGMKFRESMVKSLTSGEPILIRRMREEFIEIYPTFKLIISGNHRPDIRGGDDGIWRRVLLVPFEVQIPKDQVDRRLPEKLWAERSGILNWLVEGALAYLEEGLDVPDVVRAATDDYREQSDPFTAFLRGACELTGNDQDAESPGELYEAFKLFCAKQGFYAVGVSTFNKALPEKSVAFGFRKVKSMGLSLYRGLYIKAEFRPQPSHTQGYKND